MRLVSVLVWVTIFLLGFFLSLFLGVMAEVPIRIVLMRSTLLGFFLVSVAWVTRLIFQTYLAQSINSLVSTAPSATENKEDEIIQDWQVEQSVSEPVKSDLEEKEISWDFSIKDSSFAKWDKTGESESGDGLNKKVVKDTFQNEDPEIMAEAIRSMIAKEELRPSTEKKE